MEIYSGYLKDNKAEIEKSIEEYQKRDRRFGQIKKG